MSTIDRSLDGMSFASSDELGDALRGGCAKLGGMRADPRSRCCSRCRARRPGRCRTRRSATPPMRRCAISSVCRRHRRRSDDAASGARRRWRCCLPVAIWGWRLASHRPLSRERLRLMVWLFGAVLERGFRVLPAAQRALAAAVGTRRRRRRCDIARAGRAVPADAACRHSAPRRRARARLCRADDVRLAAGIIFAGEVQDYDDGYAAEDEDEDEEDAEKEQATMPRSRSA